MPRWTQLARKRCFGRPDVIFATNPPSPVAELRSLGLQIRRWRVILVLKKGDGTIGHCQTGNVEFNNGEIPVMATFIEQLLGWLLIIILLSIGYAIVKKTKPK